MRFRAAVLVLCGTAPLFGAIQGIVQNGTTGRYEAGVTVNLMKLDQGMQPAGSTTSDAQGKFRFDQEIGAVPFMLRAEFQGVTYNQMIPPGSRAGDVSVTVYGQAKATDTLGAPALHVLVLEPSGNQLVINEGFQYQNDAQPSVTYVNPADGTLRFYLPSEAKGVVQVSAQGPGGMAITVPAEKTGNPNIFKVNFPIKPGKSQIDLTYMVPYQSQGEFSSRTLYPGTITRVAAPEGVTIESDSVQSLGVHPETKASIFNVTAAAYKLTISGEGKLSGPPAGGESSGGGDRMSIIPAAVHNQLWIVFAFAGGILALGFYALYTASGERKPAKKRGS